MSCQQLSHLVNSHAKHDFVLVDVDNTREIAIGLNQSNAFEIDSYELIAGVKIQFLHSLMCLGDEKVILGQDLVFLYFPAFSGFFHRPGRGKGVFSFEKLAGKQAGAAY